MLLAFGMACLHFNMLDELEKWGWLFQLLSAWGWLVGFFAAGMLLYKLRHTRIFDGRIALLGARRPRRSASRCGNSSCCSRCSAAIWRCGSPSIPRLPVIPAARFGDLSYGLYIYGWPVEQDA